MLKQFKRLLLLFTVFTFTSHNLVGQETTDVEFKELKYRNVGPTRGGRATAVCGVTEAQFTFFLVSKGGGLWKTTDVG